MDEHVDTARAVPLPSAAAFGGVPAHVRPTAPVASTGSGSASPATRVPTGADVPGPSAVGTPVPSVSGGAAPPVSTSDGSAHPTPASVRVARASVGPETEEPADDGGTGDHAVDEALTLLVTLGSLPLREHVAVFDGVHTALQDRLADTEG
jgi:hypothetical protein